MLASLIRLLWEIFFRRVKEWFWVGIYDYLVISVNTWTSCFLLWLSFFLLLGIWCTLGPSVSHVNCHYIISLSYSERLFYDFCYSSGHFHIKSTNPPNTINSWDKKLLTRLLIVYYIFEVQAKLYSLCLFLFYWLLNCQLKSDHDIYEGYVPMAYGDYLTKMARYLLCLLLILKFFM